MASELSIKSDFAIVDVKAGRAALAKHFENHRHTGRCPPNVRVPITLTGYLDCIHGSDDGTSQEFQMCVESVAIEQPKSAKLIDPRDPDPSRSGIFRDHNCSRCNSGAKPCSSGNPNQCSYPHARND